MKVKMVALQLYNENHNIIASYNHPPNSGGN